MGSSADSRRSSVDLPPHINNLLNGKDLIVTYLLLHHVRYIIDVVYVVCDSVLF